MRLNHVRNQNMSGIFTIQRHVYDGSHMMALTIRDTQPPHQLPVACRHPNSVNRRQYAFPADFLHVGNPRLVQRHIYGFIRGLARLMLRLRSHGHTRPMTCVRVSPLQALANRMGGITFRQRRIFQKLFLFQFIVVHSAHLEHAQRHRPGLVKHHVLRRSQRLQIIRPLD